MSMLLERDVLLEPWFSISIGGREFAEDMLKYVSAVEVTDEDNKFSEAVIEVQDYDKKWLNGTWIGKGSEIVIKMGHRSNKDTVFKGKISFIDADYPNEGTPVLTISCVENGAKMSVTSRSRNFKKKKVSDVIIAMHKEHGLKIECQDTKTVMNEIQQSKETNTEFIHRWRKKLGWKYYQKTDGTFYFGSKDKSTTPVATLGYRTGGMEIISFTPSFSEIEEEDTDDENEIENTKANKKSSTNTKNTNKVSNSNKSTNKAVGKA